MDILNIKLFIKYKAGLSLSRSTKRGHIPVGVSSQLWCLKTRRQFNQI